MAHCSKYMKRLHKAFEHSGEIVPMPLVKLLAKKAKSDHELDQIILAVLRIIEPPYCQKSHCPHHTTYGFCGCSLALVPGRCKLHKDYLKRKSEREAKVLASRIDRIPDKLKPLSEENIGRISAMTDERFEQALIELA